MTGARLAARVADAVVLVALTRVLDPATFGVVALATAVIAVVQVFRDLGLTQALIQRAQLEDDAIHSMFWGTLGIGLVSTAAVALVSAPLAGWLDTPQLAGVVLALAAIPLLQGASLVPAALFQRRMEFKPVALRQLVGTLIGGAVGVTLAFAGWGAYALVARLLVDSVAGGVLLWVSSRYRPRWQGSLTMFWELTRFGGPIALSRFLETMQLRSVDFLIARSLGTVSVGLYSVAQQATRIVSEVVSASAVQVLTPAFARMQDDLPRLRAGYYRSIRLTSLIAFPVFVGMAAVAESLVDVVFGQAWRGAVPVLQALAVLGVVQAVRYYDTPILIAIGRPGIGLLIRAVTVAFTVLGYLWALTFGELDVFAWSLVAVALVVATPIWLVVLRHHIGISPWRVFLSCYRQLIASGVMFVVTQLVVRSLERQGGLVTLVVSVAVGAATYAGGLAILDRSTLREAVQLFRRRRPPASG